MDAKNPDETGRLHGEQRKVKPGEIMGHRVPKTTVPLSQREGVFVHSFICNHCGLHFNVYSWKANRHRADNVYCPECGQRRGDYRHFRTTLNEISAGQIAAARKTGAADMLLDKGEIFRHCPPPGNSILDDSTMQGIKWIVGRHLFQQ